MQPAGVTHSQGIQGNVASPSSWERPGPDDCVDEYCIFLNRNIGGGLALVSTVRNMERISSFEPLKLPASPPAFYAIDIPGKGVGLVANRTIRKGEIIMQRTPALLAQFGPHFDMTVEDRDELYKAAVQRLPAVRRDEFMRQMGEEIYTKMDRNSFRMFIDGKNDDSGHLGSFPDVSRFNHDCRPNYIDVMLPRHERQRRLDSWGFTCTCPQCSLGPTEAAASDDRLWEIDQFESDLEKAVTGGGQISPEMGADLVKLYRDERLFTYLGHAYTRAALIYSMFGDEGKTREHAAQAAEALSREVGPQAKDADAMRELASDPRAHWSWGLRKGS
ncbi:hypothetical protein B0T17DRAFT_615929 [Bombardia bombarda]|uniref:SET domain-containing protein n=1 Tax=Bombardia bombarda TaxID=252184 RepID=A0AA40CAH4_9PEZI|nr:hypothetical protein B0T17DRAFT_615929 [Bombardia bombarda]